MAARRKTVRAITLLGRLERLKSTYGGDASSGKRELLQRLDRRQLGTLGQVARLHEVLCFLRAYPDDRRVLAAVERMLRGFDGRRDLRRHAAKLADTGIAGTRIHFPFFFFTAIWLAGRWPEHLHIDWSEFENAEKVDDLLQFLVPYSETPGLDMVAYTPRQWLAKLKGPRETDATFLIRRFQALKADDFARELMYENLDVPLLITPGSDTPARTRAKDAGARVVYQTAPLMRARPDLMTEVERPPVAVRTVSRARGEELADLMRGAMVTRERDLYTFSHANANDVRMVDCGGGLQFACFGTIPQRRLILEALYGFLSLKNGVPIGYVLASSLFGSTEVAYNVFESFRDAEAGAVFGRVLGTARHLFGADAFAIDPYQLGYDNEEGLQSGAWWFYYKFGFRPIHPYVCKLVRSELRKMKRNPRHRSSVETLNELASEPMYWYSEGPRSDVMLRLPLGQIGLKISRYLAKRFGAEREAGIETCAQEAARALGVRLTGLNRNERLAWARWSPLVRILPGVGRWSTADRRAAARVILAKGARRETDFVELFDRHARLRRAVVRLARGR